MNQPDKWVLFYKSPIDRVTKMIGEKLFEDEKYVYIKAIIEGDQQLITRTKDAVTSVNDWYNVQ